MLCPGFDSPPLHADPFDRPPEGGLHGCEYYPELPGLGTLLKEGTGKSVVMKCKEGRTYGEVAYSAIGAYRNGNCTLDGPSRSWNCPTVTFRKMDIESLDADAATRQVVPLVLVTEGFLEFYNGGMDHGWCGGYSCLERQSRFSTTVAVGQKYDMAFTGQTPDALRFSMLTAVKDEKVVVGFWYETANVRRVFWDGKRVPGITERTGANGPLRKPTTADQCGANTQIFQKLYIVVCGAAGGVASLEVRTTTSLQLGVDLVVEEDDFYEDEKVVEYLVALLGVSKDQVRASKPGDSGTGVTRRAQDAARRLSETAAGGGLQPVSFLLQGADPCEDEACGNGECIELATSDDQMICQCAPGWRASSECVEGAACPCIEQDCSAFSDACVACDESRCLECNASLPFVLPNTTVTLVEDALSGDMVSVASTSYTCVDACSQPPLLAGYANSLKVCEACPPQCETCDADGCLSCRPIGNYPYRLGTECVRLCPDGFWSAEDRICRPCDSSCATCSGPGSGACTSCVSHACKHSNCPDSIRPIFDVNASASNAVGGSCLPHCPSGTYKELRGPLPRGCNYRDVPVESDSTVLRHPWVPPGITFSERMRPENKPEWPHDPECREWIIKQAELERDVTALRSNTPMWLLKSGTAYDCEGIQLTYTREYLEDRLEEVVPGYDRGKCMEPKGTSINGGGFQDGQPIKMRVTTDFFRLCPFNLTWGAAPYITCNSGCNVTCDPREDPIFGEIDHASEYYAAGGKCCNWEWPDAAQFAGLGSTVRSIVNDPHRSCSSCAAKPKGCLPPVAQSDCQPCHPACRECFGPSDHQCADPTPGTKFLNSDCAEGAWRVGDLCTFPCSACEVTHMRTFTTGLEDVADPHGNMQGHDSRRLLCGQWGINMAQCNGSGFKRC